MPGVHDMGGRPCSHTIDADCSEQVIFEEPWHARALAVTLLAGFHGKWNIDASRHSRETLPEAEYRSFSYYEVWLAALTNLLVRHGLVEADELANPEQSPEAPLSARAVPADEVEFILERGSPTSRELANKARYKAGDQVRTIQPAGNKLAAGGHSRLPAYAEGKPGTVCRSYGPHVLPDSNAHFMGEAPEHLYSVSFRAADLWPEADEGGSDEVALDLWESYLVSG